MSLTGELKKKRWCVCVCVCVCVYTHIHNGLLLSLKKNELLLFSARWVDPEIIILSEVSQMEKDKYCMISLLCEIWKIVQRNLFTEQKQTHRHRKQTYSYRRERGSGGINWEYVVNRHTLAYIKQINNKDLDKQQNR